MQKCAYTISIPAAVETFFCYYSDSCSCVLEKSLSESIGVFLDLVIINMKWILKCARICQQQECFGFNFAKMLCQFKMLNIITIL